MLAARKKSVISPKNYDKLSYCADFFVLFCIVSIFGSYTTKKIMFFFAVSIPTVVQKASSIKFIRETSMNESRCCPYNHMRIVTNFVRVYSYVVQY